MEKRHGKMNTAVHPFTSEKTTRKNRIYKASRKKSEERQGMSGVVVELTLPKSSQFSQHFYTSFQRSLAIAWLGASHVGVVPILLMNKYPEVQGSDNLPQSLNLQLTNLDSNPSLLVFTSWVFLFVFFFSTIAGHW